MTQDQRIRDLEREVERLKAENAWMRRIDSDRAKGPQL